MYLIILLVEQNMHVITDFPKGVIHNLCICEIENSHQWIDALMNKS